MNPETLLERYKDARMNVMQANHDLLVLTKDAELTKLYVEKSVIEEVGGEKGLGPNEAAQKRALSVALNDDKAYKLATGRIIQAQYQRDLAEAELDCIKFEMRIAEAMLKEREINKGNHSQTFYFSKPPFAPVPPYPEDPGHTRYAWTSTVVGPVDMGLKNNE